MLEHEISDLKKTCQQQAHIIKTKEKNEAKIASLNAELQAMKATKVRKVYYFISIYLLSWWPSGKALAFYTRSSNPAKYKYGFSIPMYFLSLSWTSLTLVEGIDREETWTYC